MGVDLLKKIAGPVMIASCFAGAALLFVQSCDREGERGENAGEPGVEDSPLQFMAAPRAEFVGAASCRECHVQEFNDWKGSDHDLAMQPATAETVLGDFSGVEFEHFGSRSRFFRKDDGGFYVNTEGPDGERRDYPIQYTFGVYPLQQYLIPFPGGRLQALNICWDSRPKEEGGQRWYHLYPDEPIPHDDVLHWTGPQFNWNYMCADCHSTNLEKHYDVATDSYDTTWSEMNVSCEACHGPGSAHVAWAKEAGDVEGYRGDMGLTVILKEPEEGAWAVDPETQQPKRTRPLQSNVQVETCAPCHSHRRPLVEGYDAGEPALLDTHLPSLLRDVLYHPDGQIKEEVYVYGSFAQSKMFHHGVRCIDCHQPHSLKTLAPGNALCVRCHLPGKYDAPTHHFHAAGSTGAQCVECHMPVTKYMVVDPRRDHSIRIPRPDLSVKLGVPNACNQCHRDKDAEWAAEAFHSWWGKESRPAHYGEIIAAGRAGEAGSESRLLSLSRNPDVPDIVRATALSVLAERPTQESLQRIVAAMQDEDPLVRASALQGLDAIDAAQRLALAGGLLEDPVRAVRIEAARALAAAPSEAFTEPQRAAFQKAVAEFIEVQEVTADRPGSHVALGLLYTDLREYAKAEEAYRTAIRVDPNDIAPRVNLAELLYQLGRVEEGGPILEEAVRRQPKNGNAHEALGRYRVRVKDYVRALESLAKAAELLPDQAPVQYFYGVALNQMGRFPDALPFLEKANRLEPANREYLVGLVTICRDNGDLASALRYADELVKRNPGEPAFLQLRESLK